MSRIRILSSAVPEFDAVYEKYPLKGHDVVMVSSVNCKTDADVRRLLVEARKDGLSFRFWSAAKEGERTVVHVSFPNGSDATAFTNTLKRLEMV